MNVLGPDLLLVVAAAVMVAGGVYLVLERSLTRVAVGLVLIGNGVNVLFIVTGGPRGGAPIVGVTPEEAMSDPLPQAMVLMVILGIAQLVLLWLNTLAGNRPPTLLFLVPVLTSSILWFWLYLALHWLRRRFDVY